MSGFFSLGGGSNTNRDDDDDDNNNNNNNSSLFLFKNEEIYNKGFELWQQYYQLHQHRLHHHNVNAANTTNNNNNNNNIVVDESNSSYNSSSGFRVMRRSGNEGVNCQDCGNQAKKDCPHLLCRTCCKSRGFHCQTHVKSTWVPAAKRRERQQQQQHQQQQMSALQQASDQQPKRIRENGGGGGGLAVACTASRLPAATTSGFELSNFPAEVNSPAVFRCVRVSAVNDGEEHLAYQTAVNIGGHVFKGILYDQGPEGQRYGGESSAVGSSSHQQHQPLDLIVATSNQNVTMVNDPSIYPTPLSAFMAGTQFFPSPRP